MKIIISYYYNIIIIHDVYFLNYFIYLEINSILFNNIKDNN